ncbi:MAG TPA: LacI family DNA-binding transcriptional regulator [Gemmatimonadaceae bacterium]
MRPVTLHDLAKHCQVSTATVSAVVNGANWVSEATRRRVQRAIEELGYHPNQLARGLKRQEGHAVGVVVSDLTNPFFTSIVRSLSHSLRAAGRTLSLCDSDHRHDLGEANLRMLLEGQIVGLVIIGDSVPEKALRAFVKRRANVPVIVIERDYQIQQVSCLLVDSEQGGYAATCHLAERGRRRIAMIAGPTTGAGSATYGRATRLEGYRRALKDLRLPFDEQLVVEGNFRYESGGSAMHTLLELEDPPDAVFAANDMMAFGAMSVVRDAGLSVPDDVALIGFDNVPMADLTTPGLTTMAMPMVELGDAAARLLDAQIRLGADHIPLRDTFSATLVARASTLGSEISVG